MEWTHTTEKRMPYETSSLSSLLSVPSLKDLQQFDPWEQQAKDLRFKSFSNLLISSFGYKLHDSLTQQHSQSEDNYC